MKKIITNIEELIIGKWYCGFTTEIDAVTGEEFDRDGEIGEYVGDGEFFSDEDGFSAGNFYFNNYDYFIQQS